ncbi:MAG: hypothetical protein P3W94_011765 [Paracoccus sp. (in: a-proteobacteria)]|nr:hypothetical protein [Paracoccus sp. (in: a-proteobacteria)]
MVIECLTSTGDWFGIPGAFLAAWAAPVPRLDKPTVSHPLFDDKLLKMRTIAMFSGK